MVAHTGFLGKVDGYFPRCAPPAGRLAPELETTLVDTDIESEM